MKNVWFDVTVIWLDGTSTTFSEIEKWFVREDWLYFEFIDGSNYVFNRESMRYFRQTVERRTR